MGQCFSDLFLDGCQKHIITSRCNSDLFVILPWLSKTFKGHGVTMAKKLGQDDLGVQKSF